MMRLPLLKQDTVMKSLFLVSALLLPAIGFADDGNAANDMVWLATASALVFLMQAGFALLESGMSRAKNALNVVMKNYMDVCFGSLIFWAIGYGLMFGTTSSGCFGRDGLFLNSADTRTRSFLLFQTTFPAAPVPM